MKNPRNILLECRDYCSCCLVSSNITRVDAAFVSVALGFKGKHRIDGREARWLGNCKAARRYERSASSTDIVHHDDQ